LLLNGNVLVAAGYNGGFLASAELYDSANYSAQIQRPINADGTSVFTVKHGVVPVKFTLTLGGTIDIISKNLFAPVAAIHQMINCSFVLDSELARHPPRYQRPKNVPIVRTDPFSLFQW